MDGRVDGKDEAEQQQAQHQRDGQRGRRAARRPGDGGKGEGDGHQQPGPADGLGDDGAFRLRLAAQQARGQGLYRAIGDDPERKETADQEEGLSPPLIGAVRQHRLKINRHADNEPHVARAEQEHPRQAEPVDAGIL